MSTTDPDLPGMVGHRQVTDTLLLAVARRAGHPFVTFDGALTALTPDGAVTLLRR